jgi:hypothetical protein
MPLPAADDTSDPATLEAPTRDAADALGTSAFSATDIDAAPTLDALAEPQLPKPT